MAKSNHQIFVTITKRGVPSKLEMLDEDSSSRMLRFYADPLAVFVYYADVAFWVKWRTECLAI